MALRVGPRGLGGNVGSAYVGLRRLYGCCGPTVGLAFGDAKNVCTFVQLSLER